MKGIFLRHGLGGERLGYYGKKISMLTKKITLFSKEMVGLLSGFTKNSGVLI